MGDDTQLARAMDEAEVADLGPLPDPDQVSPTTDRDERPSASTADEHRPGVLPDPPYDHERGDDRVPAPPPSLTAEV